MTKNIIYTETVNYFSKRNLKNFRLSHTHTQIIVNYLNCIDYTVSQIYIIKFVVVNILHII